MKPIKVFLMINFLLKLKISLLMGCPATKEADRQEKIGDTMEIVILTKRLIHQFQMEIGILIGKVNDIKKKLAQSTRKPHLTRSKETEYSLLEQITYATHLKLIYEHLILQCKFIEDRQQLMHQVTSLKGAESENSLLKKPIETILFSISIINDGKMSLKNADIQKFHNLFTVKYKSVQQPTTLHQFLLAYYKNNAKPTHEMVKETAFTFCQEQALTVSTFNEIGLNFKY